MPKQTHDVRRGSYGTPKQDPWREKRLIWHDRGPREVPQAAPLGGLTWGMIERPKLIYNSPIEQMVEELVPHRLSRRGWRLF